MAGPLARLAQLARLAWRLAQLAWLAGPAGLACLAGQRGLAGPAGPASLAAQAGTTCWPGSLGGGAGPTSLARPSWAVWPGWAVGSAVLRDSPFKTTIMGYLGPHGTYHNLKGSYLEWS